MANIYEYEARRPEGQIVYGELSAKDEEAAERILWQNRLTLVSLKPKGRESLSLVNFLTRRVPLKEKANFARQLTTMLESGFPLLQALSIIALQTPNPRMKEIAGSLVADLEAGHPFSVALGKHQDVFSKVFISVVKSGEASGKLPQVLDELATDMENQRAFESKLRGAMLYPAFVLFALLVVGILMMVLVIPQLQKIFEEANVTLPWTTRAVIAISRFLIKYWWTLLIIIPLMIWFIRAYVRTEPGKLQYDSFKLTVPVISKLNRLIYMTRFCRTFGLLVMTGIPILAAIRMTSEVMNNVIYENSLNKIYEQVERGIPISTPLSRDPNFPPMIGQMIGVGEKTGRLDDILKGLADYYGEETDTMVKGISSLLEPILIVLVGLAVAVMVFSIIMPIYDIARFYGG